MNISNVERARIVSEQSPVEAADDLAKMAPEDIKEILAELPTQQALEVASHLADSVEPEDVTTRAIMAEVEEVVGDLMTSEPAVLPDAATVAEALSFLVKSAETSQIEHIFVTGEES